MGLPRWVWIPTLSMTPPKQSAPCARLAEGNYAVIYITEALAAEIDEELDRYRSQRLPAIILIPGVSGNTRPWDRRRKTLGGAGCWLRHHFRQ